MNRRTLFLAISIVCWAAYPLAHAQDEAAAASGYVCPPCGCDQHGIVFEAAGSCPGCGMDLVAVADLTKVAILVYPGVELLDFAGPGEVFAAAQEFYVYTVGTSGEPILSQGFVTVDPQFGIADAPPPDILVIPGGNSSAVRNDGELMTWIRSTSEAADHVLSVCTGAMVLAELGLLDGGQATTHWGAIEGLRAAAPKTEVLENVRYVDNGKVVTSAGVSAGIDMALHVVSKILGEEKAKSTARYMEYDWTRDN
jgi:transcriptional regulator GlxA family with amidase domain